ncbi:MAG: ATP-grasp domain-containing protein [Pirellulaceae bacterium]|nr:ATP-grasp domain-containing protein [Pirellulaceae bacterium]
MRKRRIMVLMHQELIPPETLEGVTDAEMMEWKTEFDVVQTLRYMGHEATPVGASDDLSKIRDAITELRPHVCFNLLEEFHGVGTYDQHVVSYLELCKQHYTGCNPRGLMLSHDKYLAKKIMTYHRISTPRFTVIPRGKRVRYRGKLDYPLLVKSVIEDASLGISESSLVHDEEGLNRQVTYLHETLRSDALVEEYIAGREFYVGMLGNQRLKVLPIWEMKFTKAPKKPTIATAKVKWDAATQERLGVETSAAELPDELRARIIALCKRVYKALDLSGYARIDLRCNAEGKVYVLEANPNPNLSFGEDFAESADSDGIEYEELLARILNLGLSYQAHWRNV